MSNITSTDQTLANQIAFVGNQIDLWVSNITVPLGVILNAFSIYIYSRPNLNKTTMGFYYINLTVWNTIVLLLYLFVVDTKSMNYDMSVYSNFSCIVFMLLTKLPRQSNQMFIVIFFLY